MTDDIKKRIQENNKTLADALESIRLQSRVYDFMKAELYIDALEYVHQIRRIDPKSPFPNIFFKRILNILVKNNVNPSLYVDYMELSAIEP